MSASHVPQGNAASRQPQPKVDLAQSLAQLLPLWMFAGPVLYPRDFLPAHFRGWLDWNPFTFYAEYMRQTVLAYGHAETPLLLALAIAILVLAIGYAVFRRLASHFEDFL